MRPIPPRRPEAAWVLLVLLAALVLLLKLGYSNLFLFDESLYCGATADMAAHGQWLYPTDGGRFYSFYGKPPLINWLQAAATSVLGWSIFSLRLPTALGMLALVLLTGLTAGRLLGRRPGLVAAGLILLSTRMVHTGRHILLENLVAPLFAGALLLYAAAIRATETGKGEDAPARFPWWQLTGAGLCIALAILTKQAFGLFAPAALVVAEVVSRKPGWLPRLTVAGGVALAASAWWFIWAHLAVGPAFVDSLLGYHVQERFAGVLEGHARGLNAYALALDDHLRVLPWALAAVGWVAVYPRLSHAWQRFLFVSWSALALIEFLVVGVAIKTFLPWYQLVVMPPLFIGAAHVLVTWLSLDAVPRWVRWSVPLVVAAGAASSARLDAPLALGLTAGAAALAARYGWTDRLPTRAREFALIGLAGVLGLVVANPWHGGDGRYRVADMLRHGDAASSHAIVIGDEWTRVWMCYAPGTKRVEWSGTCRDIEDQARGAQYVILDGAASECPASVLSGGQELHRGKTKQGGIVLYERVGMGAGDPVASPPSQR